MAGGMEVTGGVEHGYDKKVDTFRIQTGYQPDTNPTPTGHFWRESGYFGNANGPFRAPVACWPEAKRARRPRGAGADIHLVKSARMVGIGVFPPAWIGRGLAAGR